MNSQYGPFRLWCIDDDENDTMLMKRAIAATSRACHLTCFPDALEAIAAFERLDNPEAQAPHLIITDLKMPGKSGIDFVRWLRGSRFACLPVIVFTASALPPDSLAAYRYGANSFATKPMSYPGLQKFVETIFDYWIDVCSLHTHSPLLSDPLSVCPGAWASSKG